MRKMMNQNYIQERQLIQEEQCRQQDSEVLVQGKAKSLNQLKIMRQNNQFLKNLHQRRKIKLQYHQFKKHPTEHKNRKSLLLEKNHLKKYPDKLLFYLEHLQQNILLQQDILKRTATPDRLASEIEIQTNNNNNTNMKRQAGKKHSTTKTNTKQIQEPTEGNQNMTSAIDNQTYLPTIPQIFSQFDKMQMFTHFFPFSNYDIIIKRYARIQKYFGKKRQYPESSKYSFYFMTIKKGWKLKRLGEKLQGFKLMETIKKPFGKTIQGTKIIKTKNIINTLGNLGQVSPQLENGQGRLDGLL